MNDHEKAKAAAKISAAAKARWARVKAAGGLRGLSLGSAEPRPTVGKLELMTQETAEKEKEIEAQWKSFSLADKGQNRGESLTYAYAAIAGAAANRLADLLPRGSLEVTLREKFPHRSISQIHVWRQFAKDLTPHLADSPMVGLLTAPIIGKKQIPAKKLEGFQEAVKKVLKGASMVEFHKTSQFSGEVAEPGGDRGGAGKKKARTAEEQVENAAAAGRAAVQALRDLRAQEEELKLMPLAVLNEIEEERLELGRKLAEIKELRKAAQKGGKGAKGPTEKHINPPAEPLLQFYAFQTSFALKHGHNPIVKPYDIEAIIEACKSPYVTGIIRMIEAHSLIEAEAVANRRFLAGDYEKTFGHPSPQPPEGGTPNNP
jgi:hypothetical protein